MTYNPDIHATVNPAEALEDLRRIVMDNPTAFAEGQFQGTNVGYRSPMGRLIALSEFGRDGLHEKMENPAFLLGVIYSAAKTDVEEPSHE